MPDIIAALRELPPYAPYLTMPPVGCIIGVALFAPPLGSLFAGAAVRARESANRCPREVRVSPPRMRVNARPRPAAAAWYCSPPRPRVNARREQPNA